MPSIAVPVETIRAAMVAATAAYRAATFAKDWEDARKNRELYNDLHTLLHQGKHVREEPRHAD